MTKLKGKKKLNIFSHAKMYLFLLLAIKKFSP